MAPRSQYPSNCGTVMDLPAQRGIDVRNVHLSSSSAHPMHAPINPGRTGREAWEGQHALGQQSYFHNRMAC